jgi:hypothetical protein
VNINLNPYILKDYTEGLINKKKITVSFYKKIDDYNERMSAFVTNDLRKILKNMTVITF